MGRRGWGFAAGLAMCLAAGACGSEIAADAVLVEVPVGTTPSPVAEPVSPPTTAAPSTPGVLVTRSGVVAPVLGREGDAWRVRTPCGKEATVIGGTPVAQTAIVIDPGHGGREPGAVGPDGQAEGPLNLDISRRTQAALEKAGVPSVLTRTGEYEVTLQTRADIAKALQPRAFVSIHHNAEPDGPSPRPGTETYYQIASPDSKRLSGLIFEEVLRALSRFEGPWVSDSDPGAKYRPGQQGDYYAVLRLPGAVTSVLVESAFISNPAESRLLARPEVRQAEADAVTRGILRFLNTRDPGSGYVDPYPRTTPPGGGGSSPCTDPAL